MSSRSLRLTRGSIAASFATLVALLAHLAGGGDLPAPLGIAAPLILSAVICTFVSGRRLSFLRLCLSVLVAQGLFHALFTLGTGHSRAAATPGDHSHADPAIAMTVIPAASEHLMGGAPMWLSHWGAAVVTIVALYSAERMLDEVTRIGRRIAGWVGRIVLILSPRAPEIGAQHLGILAAVTRPSQPHRRADASRRGPPLVV